MPLAPRRIVSGRLTAAHPQGYFGRVAVFSLGDRPATDVHFTPGAPLAVRASARLLF